MPPGALLSVGDPHVSQGDGEISGTALESALNGLLRLTIRRDPPFSVPVLETSAGLLVHGRIDKRCFPTWPLAA
ncbi:MAG: formamidase [Mycobacterium sp.]|nr:formamidase [Mycobacterium sp.]